MRGDEESQRLRDLEQVTDATLSYLPLDDLLDELLTRVREILDADTAAVLLLEDDGRTLVARAAKGIEEEVERRVRIPVSRGFAGRIAAEQKPVRIEDIDQADIFNPILREKGLRSLLGVPLVVEGRTVGVLHVGTLRKRVFTDEDVDLLERTADRAALSIASRLYERQRGLTEEIQRTLFPAQLPTIPGVALAARYRPAAAAALGGDWYDAFMLPGGVLGMAIGDVVGRGFKAAAMMSQLRSALRAYALEGTSPAILTGKLNALLRQIEPGGSATLLYLVYDPASGDVTASAAGHPPPVLMRAGGGREFVALPQSVPLGAAANVVFDEVTVTIDPPARLLLYTDGLVERPGEPLDTGLERLRAVMRDDVSAEALCDAILKSMLPDGPAADDAALLLMDAQPLADPLVITLPAEPDAPPLMRRVLRRWLTDRGASERETDELVLASAEAAANAIEHAYSPEPRPFRVEAKAERNMVTVTVTDWGRWRRARGQYRGRGLILMEGLADSVEIAPSEKGTTVTLTKQLLGAEAA